MEDKNKLFVFEKKEVILIFLFIILIAVIAFTLGVRTGKQLSLKHDGYDNTDIQNINLKSVDEEYVDSVVDSKAQTEPTGSNFESSIESVNQNPSGTIDTDDSLSDSEMERRLKEEMEKLASDKPSKVIKREEKEDRAKAASPVSRNESESLDTSPNYDGKYTIQLFSHQSQEAAQEFADVFRLKGYDVIINEVVIPGKGKWYRVSIGIFENVNQAKDYLNSEKDLFQNQNYIIQQI